MTRSLQVFYKEESIRFARILKIKERSRNPREIDRFPAFLQAFTRVFSRIENRKTSVLIYSLKHARSRLLCAISSCIRKGIMFFSTKTVVTPTVTMSQLGEAVVNDGPAKSWAIGSAGSAPSSSRVRTPFRQYNYFYVLFWFCYAMSSLYTLGFRTWLCTKYV